MMPGRCRSGTSTCRCRSRAGKSCSSPRSARAASSTAAAFARREGGNISILFALWLALAAALGALAVDTASLYLERRQIQAAVDLAALAAVRDPARAYELARDSLEAAGVLPAGLPVAGIDRADEARRLVVEAGRYEPDPLRQPNARFIAGDQPVNAVRVLYQRRGQVFFAAPAAAPAISARAVATVTPRVSLSIGSRLARLEGGIANAVLNQLLGTGLSLKLADYQALADAQVHALDFFDALASELRLTAVRYDDVLEAQAGRGDVARALARLLPAAEAASSALIAAAAPPSARFPAGRLIELGEFAALPLGSRMQGLDAGLSALDLLVASAALGGSSQVSVGISASVPGLTGLTATLALGEPPQRASFAVGRIGTPVRTAQVRLRLRASLLGTPVLLNAGVTLPLHVDLAYGEATVAAASCPSPAAPFGSAVIAARPGLARLVIGETSAAAFGTFSAPPPYGDATLIDALLIRVEGAARLDLAPPAPRRLGFSSAEIAAGTAKTVGTDTILTSAVGSLLGELKLSVRPLGLSLAGVSAGLKALLAPVTPVLDYTLDGLLAALGLGLGEADIRVYGVTCASPVLVE